MVEPASQPNILFVIADQLSALATSPYGNRDVLTPNMEARPDERFPGRPVPDVSGTGRHLFAGRHPV